MSIFYIEHRELSELTSLSWDIAHHMYTRFLHGHIVIATHKPTSLLPSVSKQWRKVVRQVQRERASTMQTKRINELMREGAMMEHLRMTTKKPSQNTTHGVFFIAIEELLKNPPACQTLYIADTVNDADFAQLTTNMPYHSLIVRY